MRVNKAAMDVGTLVRELRQRLELIDRAIAHLKALQMAGGDLGFGAKKKRRGRKSMDSTERRQVSERMKQYWADRRQHRTA